MEGIHATDATSFLALDFGRPDGEGDQDIQRWRMEHCAGSADIGASHVSCCRYGRGRLNPALGSGSQEGQ